MIRAIITDVEGTTSSISFVKDVLFPYAFEHLPAYVREHARDPRVRDALQEVAQISGIAPQDTEGLIHQLLRWIQEDRKVTSLKSLQGMVWQDGYEQGVYTAHVYPEVAQCLRQWRDQGMSLYVYSSGSVQAQRLFFRHSAAGDLTPLFSGYFDTTTGPKQEAASYQKIADCVGRAPGELLFLSDIRAELDAARAAGLHTCWLVRGSDSTVEITAGHAVARDFTQVQPIA